MWKRDLAVCECEVYFLEWRGECGAVELRRLSRLLGALFSPMGLLIGLRRQYSEMDRSPLGSTRRAS